MKELKLTDRIVVEIKGEQTGTYPPHFVAEQLRAIADAIETGTKGNNHTDCSHEILWEYECPEYGGFKIVSNKSLISQYYYHSELAPRIISEELADDIRKFNKDYEENEQEVGEDIETKTDYLCDAVNLLAQVEQQTKIAI